LVNDEVSEIDLFPALGKNLNRMLNHLKKLICEILVDFVKIWNYTTFVKKVSDD
jgi:hypothetical protein